MRGNPFLAAEPWELAHGFSTLSTAVSPPGLVGSGSFSVLSPWASQFTVCTWPHACRQALPILPASFKVLGTEPKACAHQASTLQLSQPCVCFVWGCPVACELAHSIPGLCLLQANSILTFSQISRPPLSILLREQGAGSIILSQEPLASGSPQVRDLLVAWEETTQWTACCFLGPFSVRKKPSATQVLALGLFSGWFVAWELPHIPLGLVLPLQWLHVRAAYASFPFSFCKLRVSSLSSFCPPLPHPCLVHWGAHMRHGMHVEVSG